MKIKFRQDYIEIPEKDPFQYDLLGRKESVEILTNLISSIDGPCVLSIDAEWGKGKTTFLRLWRRYLYDMEFPVTLFNAWETDFSNDPFIAMTSELMAGIKSYSGNSINEKIKDLEESANLIMNLILSGTIRHVSAGIIDINSIKESFAEKRLGEYTKAKEIVKNFKNQLQEVSTKISKSNNNRPLVLMIDELDRCRPSYAVELLEVAKHLFSVDGIIFILAINCSQLSHSIKALYGHDFDSQGYIKRFIDVDIRLPSPDRKAFIEHQLSNTNIKDLIEPAYDKDMYQNYNSLRDILYFFFNSYELDLRQISQAIHRLYLIFGSLGENKFYYILATTVALVFRCIDSNLYHKFCNGEVNDLQVSEIIFKNAGMQSIREQKNGHLFESILILGYREISKVHNADYKFPNSPLLDKYKKQNNIDSSENKNTYATNIVYDFEHGPCFPCSEYQYCFIHAVKRIELLSSELINPDLSSE